MQWSVKHIMKSVYTVAIFGFLLPYITESVAWKKLNLTSSLFILEEKLKVTLPYSMQHFVAQHSRSPMIHVPAVWIQPVSYLLICVCQCLTCMSVALELSQQLLVPRDALLLTKCCTTMLSFKTSDDEATSFAFLLIFNWWYFYIGPYFTLGSKLKQVLFIWNKPVLFIVLSLYVVGPLCCCLLALFVF